MNFEDHSTVGYIDSFLGLFFEKEWASTAVGMYVRGFQLDNTGPHTLVDFSCDTLHQVLHVYSTIANFDAS